MKRIKAFRTENYGCFVDLEDIDASLAIDPQTGDILLNEGQGDDRFHGAAILRESIIGLSLEQVSEAEFQVILKYGKERTHSLGVTSQKAQADVWIQDVSLIMASATVSHAAGVASAVIKALEAEFILVVHDDPETANSICKVLELGNIRSAIVQSRTDAERELMDNTKWHRCRGCVIDIGLLDGASAGWDLARWIRDREGQIVIETNSRKRLIGVTAHVARAHFFEPEIFDVGLQTPYAPAKLLDAFS